MNYWENIDNSINELILQGYCYLPPINNLVDLKKATYSLLEESKDRTFNENLKTHIEINEKLQVQRYLTPKLLKVAKEYFNFSGEISDQYHITRIVKTNIRSEFYRSHFDSHCFTLILPINILKPYKEQISSQECGDLYFFPNARKAPTTELINLSQKILYRRFRGRKGFLKLSKKINHIQVPFSDYRPLLFVGLNTFHGNFPISSETSSQRVSLLSHFFDPSNQLGLSRFTRFLRNR